MRRWFLNEFEQYVLLHNYRPLKVGVALHWTNIQGSFVPSLNQISPVVFFNYINIFSLLGYYLPLEKGMALHLKKPELPSPKDALCQVSLKLDQYVVLQMIFKLCSCIFTFFVIISFWKKAWLFSWTNLNHLHPRMLFGKFGWN